MTKLVSPMNHTIWNLELTAMLVRATNTRTKTRYAFGTVKSEEVKVSATRPPAKMLATRMSYRFTSTG